MLRRPTWTALVLAVFVMTVLLACRDTETHGSLENVVVGFEERYGVFIVNGSGRLLAHKRARWSRSGQLQVAYFSPAVHPNHESFSAISCTDLPISRSAIAGGSAKRCQLLEWRLEDDRERLLLETTDGVEMDSATWRSDGARLALLVGREVVVLEASGRKVVSRTEIADLHSTSPWGYPWGRTYLRWSADGERLYLTMWPPEGTLGWPVGSVDPSRASFEWLPVEPLRFLRGQFRGDPRTLADDPGIAALFGSSEHPVLLPYHSADRRFYFSYQGKDGWFARYWIEGFDTETGEVFDLLTVSRRLWAP